MKSVKSAVNQKALVNSFKSWYPGQDLNLEPID
jgi:hypothetical protein